MYDTKVNLTTILAIIVFLAVMAFLFVPVRTGPHHSIGMTCLSNLKQQGMGELIYSTDHDDRLPDSEAWMDRCAPYFKTEYILHCPAIDQANTSLYGYAMNCALSDVNIVKLAKPGDRVLILESIILERNASTGLVGFPNPPRHKRNMLVMADGHGKAETSVAKYR